MLYSPFNTQQLPSTTSANKEPAFPLKRGIHRTIGLCFPSPCSDNVEGTIASGRTKSLDPSGRVWEGGTGSITGCSCSLAGAQPTSVQRNQGKIPISQSSTPSAKKVKPPARTVDVEAICLYYRAAWIRRGLSLNQRNDQFSLKTLHLI